MPLWTANQLFPRFFGRLGIFTAHGSFEPVFRLLTVPGNIDSLIVKPADQLHSFAIPGIGAFQVQIKRHGQINFCAVAIVMANSKAISYEVSSENFTRLYRTVLFLQSKT